MGNTSYHTTTTSFYWFSIVMKGHEKFTLNPVCVCVCVSVCVFLTWLVLRGETLGHKFRDVFVTPVRDKQVV